MGSPTLVLRLARVVIAPVGRSMAKMSRADPSVTYAHVTGLLGEHWAKAWKENETTNNMNTNNFTRRRGKVTANLLEWLAELERNRPNTSSTRNLESIKHLSFSYRNTRHRRPGPNLSKAIIPTTHGTSFGHTSRSI